MHEVVDETETVNGTETDDTRWSYEIALKRAKTYIRSRGGSCHNHFEIR